MMYLFFSSSLLIIKNTLCQGTSPSVILFTYSESLMFPRQPLPETEYNGNPESVGYRVRVLRADLRGEANIRLVNDRLEREITLEGLEEWTEYQLQIQAFNSIGPGPWSETVKGRTRESGEDSQFGHKCDWYLSDTETYLPLWCREHLEISFLRIIIFSNVNRWLANWILFPLCDHITAPHNTLNLSGSKGCSLNACLHYR